MRKRILHADGMIERDAGEGEESQDSERDGFSTGA